MFNNKKPEVTTPPKAQIPSPTPRSTTNNVQYAIPTNADQEKTIVSKNCFIKGEMSGADDISILGKVEAPLPLKTAS